MHFILIGIGGFGGAVSRYFLFQLAQLLLPTAQFPWGTLAVNLLGSFFLGAVFSLFLAGKIPMEAKLFLATGFLGSFTTFSTYTLDCFQLLRHGQYYYLAGYFLLNNGLSFLALTSGYLWLKNS